MDNSNITVMYKRKQSNKIVIIIINYLVILKNKPIKENPQATFSNHQRSTQNRRCDYHE